MIFGLWFLCLIWHEWVESWDIAFLLWHAHWRYNFVQPFLLKSGVELSYFLYWTKERILIVITLQIYLTFIFKGNFIIWQLMKSTLAKFSGLVSYYFAFLHLMYVWQNDQHKSSVNIVLIFMLILIAYDTLKI